jgi:hypothetical protein
MEHPERMLPSNYYIISRQDDLIQEGQQADDLMFEDRTG